MEAIDALKQKILSLAIQGKLVPQDPNDEPASELLEKIKAEKAELVKQGKIKKDKQESRIYKGDDNKYYEQIGTETKDITDEIPFEIPNNWEWVRLKNVVSIETGKKDANYGSPNGKYLFFTCASEPIKCDNYSFSGESLILPGNGANVGLCIYYNGNFEAYQRTYVLQGYGKYLIYLKLVLDALWKSYNLERLYGSAMPYIKLGNIEEFLAPLPPLSEQKRIASEIEKIFNQIEIVKENQEELSKLKDGLKNKILDLAIQGKLVEQDPNDEPASELLKKIKAEKAELVKQGKIKKDKQESRIYKGDDNRHYEQIGSEVRDITDEIPFEIPNNWCWVRLGSIINYGETKALTYSECNKSLWILDLEDIEKDTSRILCKNRIKDKPFKSTKKTFIKGDVLYSKLRPYLNKVVVADEDGVCTSEILPFRIYYGIIPEYLQCCLKSHYFYEYVNQLTYGVKMPRLGTEDGKKGLIPLPPLREQCRIIQKLSKLLEFTNQL